MYASALRHHCAMISVNVLLCTANALRMPRLGSTKYLATRLPQQALQGRRSASTTNLGSSLARPIEASGKHCFFIQDAEQVPIHACSLAAAFCAGLALEGMASPMSSCGRNVATFPDLACNCCCICILALHELATAEGAACTRITKDAALTTIWLGSATMLVPRLAW